MGRGTKISSQVLPRTSFVGYECGSLGLESQDEGLGHGR